MKKILFAMLAILLMGFTASANAYIFTNDGTYFGRDISDRSFGYGGYSYGLTPIQGSYQSNEAFNTQRSRSSLFDTISRENDLFSLAAQFGYTDSSQNSLDSASGRDARSFSGTVGQGDRLTGKTIVTRQYNAAGKGNDFFDQITIEKYGDVEGRFNVDNFNDYNRRNTLNSRNVAGNAGVNRNSNSFTQNTQTRNEVNSIGGMDARAFQIDLRRFI
jgi:hypothetical protein